MYYLLSLLAGMMISVMVVFNGGLSARAGQAMALVIIHVAGLLLLTAFFIVKREKPSLKKLPLWLYTGGLLGILTTVFNNTAFGHISISAMMALALLGDSVSSLLADHFGLIGVPRRPFRAEKLWGGLLTLAGIVWMLNEFRPLPVLLSLLAGVTVLFSRLVNGRLARETSLGTGALYNYLVGLLAALLLLFLTKSSPAWSFSLSGPPSLYLGGVLGAVIVLLSNFIVGRISSFYMALALFVGQVSASLLLDMLLTRSFPLRTAIGGLFVLGGLVINLMQDKVSERRNQV
jgi:transporter family-2 protein